MWTQLRVGIMQSQLGTWKRCTSEPSPKHFYISSTRERQQIKKDLQFKVENWSNAVAPQKCNPWQAMWCKALCCLVGNSVSPHSLPFTNVQFLSRYILIEGKSEMQNIAKGATCNCIILLKERYRKPHKIGVAVILNLKAIPYQAWALQIYGYELLSFQDMGFPTHRQLPESGRRQ